MGSYVGIQLHPCFYIICTLYVFIHKNIPIHFISLITLFEAAQLQNWCISLSLHIYCTCTPQAWCGKPRVNSWHPSLVCRMCSQTIVCMPKLGTTVHVNTKFLNFPYGKRTDTSVHWHACVKFKLSCTVTQWMCRLFLLAMVKLTQRVHLSTHLKLHNKHHKILYYGSLLLHRT